MSLHLNQEIMGMLRENFEKAPHMVVKERAQFFKFWSQRCKELEPEEKKLHENLEPHLRRVLQGKRLLVLKEILASFNYPDKTLVDDIMKGFPWSGWLPKSNLDRGAMSCRTSNGYEVGCSGLRPLRTVGWRSNLWKSSAVWLLQVGSASLLEQRRLALCSF
jgi:hypothetical protein